MQKNVKFYVKKIYINSTPVSVLPAKNVLTEFFDSPIIDINR